MPRDITIETIEFLQGLNLPKADKLAAEVRERDWRLVSTCQNCKHIKLGSNWCGLNSFHTSEHSQKTCFDPHPDYTEITAPIY